MFLSPSPVIFVFYPGININEVLHGDLTDSLSCYVTTNQPAVRAVNKTNLPVGAFNQCLDTDRPTAVLSPIHTARCMHRSVQQRQSTERTVAYFCATVRCSPYR